MAKAKKTADKPAKKKQTVKATPAATSPAEGSTEILDSTPIEYGKVTKKFIAVPGALGDGE